MSGLFIFRGLITYKQDVCLSKCGKNEKGDPVPWSFHMLSNADMSLLVTLPCGIVMAKIWDETVWKLTVTKLWTAIELKILPNHLCLYGIFAPVQSVMNRLLDITVFCFYHWTYHIFYKLIVDNIEWRKVELYVITDNAVKAMWTLPRL